MNLNEIIRKKLKVLNRETTSIDCETAFKKFQSILTIEHNEFLPENPAKKQSEKTRIDNQVIKSAAYKNTLMQVYLEREVKRN